MFSLRNFEGPLDLLWQLVTKDEIDIATIPLHEITTQFHAAPAADSADKRINAGAEFIGLISLLIWYKSLRLLPKSQQEPITDLPLPVEEDPANILHHLIDYCRFKQAAKELSSLEQLQSSIYQRGTDTVIEPTPTNGIQHISLDDLASLFQKILAKSKPYTQTLREEPWKVSDKITFLLNLLQEKQKQNFEDVFHADLSREELIVTFLALLELMKAGKAAVNKVEDSFMILYVR